MGGSAEVPIATMHVSVGDRTPIVRRPARQDALDLAHATFRSGVRVEMGALAAQLGISQPTLYRWVGTREQLLDAVLERITDETVAVALTAAKGDGDERVLDFIRRFADASGTFQAGHKFIAREPELALRLILSERRGVHHSAANGLRRIIGETRSAEQARALDERIDLMVQAGAALQWATVAAGDDPRIEGAIEVVRALLVAAPPSRPVV